MSEGYSDRRARVIGEVKGIVIGKSWSLRLRLPIRLRIVAKDRGRER
jgi:hypothetical protein